MDQAIIVISQAASGKGLQDPRVSGVYPDIYNSCSVV